MSRDRWAVGVGTAGGLVSTYAGIPGTPGHGDGPALSATFNGPSHLALDGQGNLYVTDFNNHTVRMITPAGPVAGAVTTLAGLPGQSGCTDGPVAVATFDGPSGIVVAGDSVYIVDCNSNTLRCLAGGSVSTVAGAAYQVGTASTNGTGTAALFNFPIGLARDGQGQFYIADSGSAVIRRCTPAFEVSTHAGSGEFGIANGPAATAQFYWPLDVAVDGQGNVYVADSSNGCLVRKINPAGEVSTLAGKAGQPGITNGRGTQARFSFGLGCLAVDTKGTLTIVDNGSNTLRKVTPAGLVSTLAGQAAPIGCANGSRLTASFSAPRGLALDRSGNLYVGDDLNAVIRKITPAGVVSILAGRPGLPGHTDGPAGSARFGQSLGLAVDGAGFVYVADHDHNTIRKITPEGRVSTLAGSSRKPPGGVDARGAKARFHHPWGLAVDEEGNVYVADAANSAIRMITPEGVVSTYAGKLGESACTDAPVHAEARFTHPFGLCRDPSGNLYVADGQDNTIRRIDAKGGVSLVAGQPNTADCVDSAVGSAARFNALAQIGLDANLNLFVADQCNAVVRRITPSGAVDTVAGTAEVFATVPGPLPASLDTPYGIALDPATGDLFTTADNAVLRVRLGPSPRTPGAGAS